MRATLYTWAHGCPMSAFFPGNPFWCTLLARAGRRMSASCYDWGDPCTRCVGNCSRSVWGNACIADDSILVGKGNRTFGLFGNWLEGEEGLRSVRKNRFSAGLAPCSDRRHGRILPPTLSENLAARIGRTNWRWTRCSENCLRHAMFGGIPAYAVSGNCSRSVPRLFGKMRAR